MSGGRGQVDWADLLAAPVRRNSVEVAAQGARAAAMPGTHASGGEGARRSPPADAQSAPTIGRQKHHAPSPPGSAKRSDCSASPRRSVQKAAEAALPRRSVSPQPSPAARPSASGVARAALAHELAREAHRTSHEPAGAPLAQTIGQQTHHAQARPAAHPSASGMARAALEHELIRRANRTKHAREPVAVQASPRRTQSQVQRAEERATTRLRSPKREKIYCGTNKKSARVA